MPVTARTAVEVYFSLRAVREEGWNVYAILAAHWDIIIREDSLFSQKLTHTGVCIDDGFVQHTLFEIYNCLHLWSLSM